MEPSSKKYNPQVKSANSKLVYFAFGALDSWASPMDIHGPWTFIHSPSAPSVFHGKNATSWVFHTPPRSHGLSNVASKMFWKYC